jgi:HD-like signal output (HDOD) protein
MVDIRTFRYLLANKIAGHKLPVIRATTAHLVALLTNPHSDLKSIANAVLRDQSLTARVLSIANSVYYRRQDEHTTSIARAVLQLGRSPLRNIAVASEFVEFTRKQASGTLDIRRLLAKSFVAAHQALALGRSVEMPETEALFTSTLLSSLGELTLASFLPTVSQQIEETASAQKLSYDEAHFQVTGMSPHEVAMIVATRIRIPEELLLPPPDWDTLSQWTVTERRQAVVHLANAWAASLLLIRVCDNFDCLMDKTAQAFSLPGSTVANALTEGFHDALDAGASVNLDAESFALTVGPTDDPGRRTLIQSCARAHRNQETPTPVHTPATPPMPSKKDRNLAGRTVGRGGEGSLLSRLFMAFRRVLR